MRFPVGWQLEYNRRLVRLVGYMLNTPSEVKVRAIYARLEPWGA